MKAQIALITILTSDIPKMLGFYRDVLGFRVKNDMGEYVELESEGVRFALCQRSIMQEATGHTSFQEPRSGQSFELAFPLDFPSDVDQSYQEIVDKGATPVKAPATMPWHQRTAFFADPDGNIHELFAELPEAT
jgi:catechol 2,3-dioxygenase-like lactoylglutathione lyase family enzyme